MRVKLQGPLFPFLAVAALLLQLVAPSRAWTTILVAFGGASLAAFLWGWILARNLHLQRERRVDWIQVGGRIEERLTLKNTSLLPAPWITLRDHSTLPNYNVEIGTGLNAGDFKQWNEAGPCDRRGLFHLGPADIETGDPFGIFQFTVHASHRTSVLILPPIVPLPALTFAPAGFGDEGQPRPRAWEGQTHAATVREHRPEDSLRLIHWPTTARQGQLFVHQFDSAPAGDCWIVLDLQKQPDESIEETCVTLAASVANEILLERQRVGILINARDSARLPPQNGEGQRWAILESLAIAQAGDANLNRFLESAKSFIHRRAGLVIVTADTRLDWLTPLESFRARGFAPTILLLDPASFGNFPSAQPAAETLRQRNIPVALFTRAMLKPATETQTWSWQKLSSGGFIPVRAPMMQKATR